MANMQREVINKSKSTCSWLELALESLLSESISTVGPGRPLEETRHQDQSMRGGTCYKPEGESSG